MSAWGDYLPKSEAEQLDLKLRAMFGGILDDMTGTNWDGPWCCSWLSQGAAK